MGLASPAPAWMFPGRLWCGAHVADLGFWVVQGLRFTVEGSGFRVEGLQNSKLKPSPYTLSLTSEGFKDSHVQVMR